MGVGPLSSVASVSMIIRWSRSMPGTTAGHTDAVGQQIPNLLGDQLDAQRH
jgi:hypothetical protein